MGTAVTFAATVVSGIRDEQVTFSDNYAGTKRVLGTAVIPSSGPTEGIDALRVQSALSTNFYNAQWSGTSPVGTLNIVAYAGDTVLVVQLSLRTANASASFSVMASGTPTPIAQWHLSTNGGAQWTAVTGAAETTYTTLATTAADSGDQYRAVFTNGAGSVTSKAAGLTVNVNGLVAANGAVFAFGDTAFYGSMGDKPLNKPIVGIASTPTRATGRWPVKAGSSVSATPDSTAPGAGTTTSQIVSPMPTGDNGGHWETAASGHVFQFADVTSAGMALAQKATIAAMSD